MKKPFLGISEFIYSPLHHPALTQSLGAICIEWALFESLISMYYARLVFGERDQIDTAEATIIEAFESLPNWTVKTKLLVSAAKRRLGKDTSADLQKLLKSKPIENAHRSRNAVVHARWATSEAEPGKWVRIRGMATQEDHELYEISDFMEVRAKISRAGKMLGGFIESVRPRLKNLDVFSAYLDAFNSAKNEDPGNG